MGSEKLWQSYDVNQTVVQYLSLLFLPLTFLLFEIRSQYIAQADFKILNPPASVSPELGFQM